MPALLSMSVHADPEFGTRLVGPQNTLGDIGELAQGLKADFEDSVHGRAMFPTEKVHGDFQAG
jgi:hypothetical protein